MPRRLPYTFVYARWVAEHSKSIDARYDTLIRDKIQEQLQYDPGVETKNRKPLRQPAALGAHWEIRFGPDNRFRVLYDINEEEHTVEILAIGEKVGNTLIIAGEEVGS